MSRSEAETFFETYRDAFNRLDGNAVADLWHLPSAIAATQVDGSAAELTLWTDDAAMRANHRALCAIYRDSDYHRAEFEIIDCVNLGAQHAFANIAWALRRANGSLLQAFNTGYILMRTAQGPKVALAIAHEEDIHRMRNHDAS